jgi:hypothetical protein
MINLMPCRNPCILLHPSCIHIPCWSLKCIGESNLDRLRLFHQWECLKCNGHGLSVSCVKWPLCHGLSLGWHLGWWTKEISTIKWFYWSIGGLWEPMDYLLLKVCRCYSVTFLNWTSYIFDWCVVRCGSKNAHTLRVTWLTRDWTMSSSFINYSTLNNELNDK